MIAALIGVIAGVLWLSLLVQDIGAWLKSRDHLNDIEPEAELQGRRRAPEPDWLEDYAQDPFAPGPQHGAFSPHFLDNREGF